MSISSILLIDDHYPTNFLHRIVIEEHNFAEEVIIKETAKDALEYLNQIKATGARYPDIILVDINMPVMNGFEFVDQCAEFHFCTTLASRIFMLTTSINPKEKEKALNSPCIQGFFIKPLTPEMLDQMLTML